MESLQTHNKPPKWIQQNLVLRVTHFGEDINTLNFNFLFPHTTKSGNADVEFKKGAYRWTGFFPNGDDTPLVQTRSGYGTFSQCICLLSMYQIIGKERFSSMYIAEDHRPSDARIGLLSSMGLDWQKAYILYDYLVANLEASKRKGFILGDIQRNKLPETTDTSLIYDFRFPPTPLNVIQCQQCILHGASCRLHNTHTPEELLRILEQDAPIERYSQRTVEESGWGQLVSLPKSAIYENGSQLSGECFDTDTQQLFGEARFSRIRR